MRSWTRWVSTTTNSRIISPNVPGHPLLPRHRPRHPRLREGLREGAADPHAGVEAGDAVGPRPAGITMEARPVVVVAGVVAERDAVDVGVDVAAAHPLDEHA